MRTVFFLLIVLLVASAPVLAEEGIVSVKSPHGVKETADRLEKAAKGKGMTIFNRVNHAENAQKIGITLRPTELLIFGNPKVGSPLMQCSQSAAIDLPQKALIWEDEKGQVWLSYNNPEYLGERHTIQGCDKIIAKIKKALSGLAKAASAP